MCTHNNGYFLDQTKGRVMSTLFYVYAAPRAEHRQISCFFASLHYFPHCLTTILPHKRVLLLFHNFDLISGHSALDLGPTESSARWVDKLITTLNRPDECPEQQSISIAFSTTWYCQHRTLSESYPVIPCTYL